MIETKNFQGPPNNISPPITAGAWSFGPVGGYFLTESLRLNPNGKVTGYDHPNERSWRIENYRLLILAEDGTITWRTVETFKDKDGLINVVLENPVSTQTRFILKQNTHQLAPLETPTTKPTDSAAQSPLSGISDAEFLFPSNLEVTPVRINKVLLVGSYLTALYHEQLHTLHPETDFDYIPYNFVSALPDTPPSPPSDYSFQYLQIPLCSVLSDRVIWGFRFNENGFARTILEDAYSVIDTMLASAMIYNEQHGMLTFVSNFIVPQISTASSLNERGGSNDLITLTQKLNDYLREKITTYKNSYLLNVDTITSTIGKRYILDDTIYFHSHGAVACQDWDDFGSIARNEPIPPLKTVYPVKKEAFLDAIFRQMVTAYRTIRQIDQVKAVVFSLDNTLWRGQLSENYRLGYQPWPRTDGWPLGLWGAIHSLRARGILVAICSKDDYDYVKSRWDDVVEPKLLSLDDFSSVKINRLPKTQNLAEICQEFNIEPKNMLFVDANPVEHAAVVSALPGIRVIGGNPYLTRRILLWSAETQIVHRVGKSGKQAQIIHEQARTEDKRSSMDGSEFLTPLNCEVSFINIKSTEQAEFERTLELTNESNQFNTSGQHWSFENIADFLKSGGKILTFMAKDNFTDYGLVGALYLKGTEIVQYVMTRHLPETGVEEFAIAEAVQFLRYIHQGETNITATIKETAHNTPCRDVYIRSGFQEAPSQNGIRRFILDSKDTPKFSLHIKKA